MAETATDPLPRILTFNVHEPYLCILASLGLPMDIGFHADGDLSRAWNTAYRPIPDIFTIVEEPAWRPALRDGRYDLVIAHSETCAANIFGECLEGGAALIIVCHNRRRFVAEPLRQKPNLAEELASYEKLLARLGEYATFIFISESKAMDYGIPGTVILPGIDVDAYGGYLGEKEEILRVGNMMRERDIMFDVDTQEAACAGLPNRVVGHNPMIPGAQRAASFDELKRFYREGRCLLHVTREAWEDGYNLSMLEAMATGMPVVALANATCPIQPGVNGLTALDAAGLHSHLADLLADRQMASELGRAGRELIRERFPLERFVALWRSVIDQATQDKVNARNAAPAPPSVEDIEVPRKRILMHYTGGPDSLGGSFLANLAATHDVVSIQAPHEKPEPALAFSADVPAADLVAALPGGFAPELYFWIESSSGQCAFDLAPLDVITACLITGESLDHDARLDLARRFDFVFVGRQEFVAELHQAGILRVGWLPVDEASSSPRNHPATTMALQVLESIGALGGVAGESRYLLGGYFCNPRYEVVERMPEGVTRLLDIGCGAGEFGRVMKAKGVIEVAGFEYDARAADMARTVLDDVGSGDIENIELPFPKEHFDCITCCDVLEHLIDPWQTVGKLKSHLVPGGRLVVTLPNIEFFGVLQMLGMGRWAYDTHGIMDRTHLRFFTKREIRAMLEGAGLEIEALEPLSIRDKGLFPMDPDRCVHIPPIRIGPLSDEQYENKRTFQFIAIARKPEKGLLDAARRALESGDAIRAYELASSSSESASERLRIMAKATAQLERLDESIALYQERARLEPKNPAAQRDLALVLLAAGRLDDALPPLNAALASNPQDDRAIGAMGLVALLQEQPDRAMGFFKQALDIDFTNLAILEHLLSTARRLDTFSEAEPYLKRFVDFYPGNLEMTLKYAELLHDLGQDAAAISQLDKLMLFAPEHEGARALMERIHGEQG